MSSKPHPAGTDSAPSARDVRTGLHAVDLKQAVTDHLAEHGELDAHVDPQHRGQW